VGLEGWGDFLRVAVCAGNPQKASQAFADPLTGALYQISKWLKSSSTHTRVNRSGYEGIPVRQRVRARTRDRVFNVDDAGDRWTHAAEERTWEGFRPDGRARRRPCR
jgi:hypothetical protein